ncbi:aminoglycoside phosphotransferase (APT) family kinase protein [Actinoplanes campanulatus]|uniref:Aminoglycoside phosphotransferase (APT) family kinase protein n=1 Tax=Actinoplanes campanulatus TaxID=113559 RepID=A0A7W5AS53_9ACTN|nr:aminoglycoside phosphotransferase family protein [Actinoplanes campanulatus]MBB3101433.1 aminoglycoside phosphotransferase (APT) family kinase protein [Actinoplanes campanulatus]GGN50397.1 aminoglycoside phosphotransferase [Actinoplanes campanulatus]GID42505.1 aminoglycoside phosphotransferase [Actinoplanes campanulatus]
MESITKNRQSPDTLRAMIARAYGPDEVPMPADSAEWCSELGHGWFNVAYRIRLRGGAQVVLKIAPPPHIEVMTYEHGAMGIELASLRLIAEQTTVPVPHVDYADRSHELCDADWFLMPYIDADNFGIVRDTLTPAERDTYNEALGAANRELNSIRGTAFGPLAGPGDPTWRHCFTRMIGDVLADGERRNVDIGYDYDLIRQVIADSQDCLDEVTEPRFVEWDLWDSNVMIRDGKIIAIIDHERAFYGDPLMEAGFTAIDLPAFGDSTAFMRGYGHRELTTTERRRRRLYTLYLVLIMIIETNYRGHTDTHQYDWARERLGEVMRLFRQAGH